MKPIVKVKNPVLRFAAGLAVVGGAIAMLIGGILFGIGKLVEPLYRAMYPHLYAADGYGFWNAVGSGCFVVLILIVAAFICFLIYGAAKSLGEKFFDP